ncbi:uncharacterized protein L201_006667 [Kwoniella dendrophila CBS 6074]|uniref:Extradiol ring-cleavage dioxygenase class III enzyme subunit B domain-containing protein n=1 Tax=Kwoniella dendrophila CBS 6074 TaxID=1295534 RepID=A0AAX4K273_9TREE
MVNQTKKGDVYFLSHGGPPTIEQYSSSPYKAWQKFGKMIEENLSKGIVCVSAHWENEDESSFKSPNDVVVNSNNKNPLIYDFYNFPQRFYELKFQSAFDQEIESSVLNALKEGGISITREDRGFDHGVWVPFRAALGETTTIPIIQVSLPASSDPKSSIRLGEALSRVKEDGYTIVATGQVVHNLRDLFTGSSMPYTKPFLKAVSDSLESSDPKSSILDAIKSPIYKQAHPTNEHFYPLLVALGALSKEDERNKQDLFVGIVDMQGNDVDSNLGLGWGMWKWSSS